MVGLKSILQRLYPYGICRQGKAVYLTFDDGPIPEVTPKVLEVLDRYGVKATFFMVGENIDKHPEVFAQVVKGGHAIGNHTYNHMKGWKVSTRTYMANVAKWEEAVLRNYPKDYPAPALNRFRPPYGRTWVWERKAVAEKGYNPEAMLAQIKRCTRPGSIINFHDSVKSNERMLATLPQAIEWLLAQGYELKTLDE